MTTNAFLIRWGSGWTERVDAVSIAAVGRIETLLGLGAINSIDEVYRVADGQLAEFARARTQTDIAVEPIDDGDTPYLAFNVGDVVTVEGVSHRVLGITVTEDPATGRALFVPTLNDDMVLSPNERVFQALRKMVNGTIGGRSKVAQPVVPRYVPSAGGGGGAPAPPVWTAHATLSIGTPGFWLGGACFDAVLGDRIWASGNSTTLAHLYAYVLATDTWEDHGAIPGSGGPETVYASNGTVVVVMASNAFPSITSSTQIYDVAGNTWSTGSPMPAVQAINGSWSTDSNSGSLWYLGGQTAGSDSLTLRKYDVGADSWTTGLADIDVTELGNSVVEFGGLLYVLAYQSRVYDIGGDSWSPLTVPALAGAPLVTAITVGADAILVRIFGGSPVFGVFHPSTGVVDTSLDGPGGPAAYPSWFVHIGGGVVYAGQTGAIGDLYSTTIPGV